MRLQEYCKARDLSISSAFIVAWRYTFAEEPDILLVEHQVAAYRKHNHIPSYVEDFLKDADHLQ